MLRGLLRLGFEANRPPSELLEQLTFIYHDGTLTRFISGDLAVKPLLLVG
jgi:hypothetical protein